MSALTSVTSGGAVPSPTACFANAAPILQNITGLSGRICTSNLSPDIADITSCCNSGAEVRVQDNCTQYCETDRNDFASCVTELLEFPPTTQLSALCQDIPEGTPPSASTPSTTQAPSPTESNNEPEETEGAPEEQEGLPTLPALACCTLKFHRRSSCWSNGTLLIDTYCRGCSCDIRPIRSALILTARFCSQLFFLVLPAFWEIRTSLSLRETRTENGAHPV
jgi:hypothetical protein